MDLPMEQNRRVHYIALFTAKTNISRINKNVIFVYSESGYLHGTLWDTLSPQRTRVVLNTLCQSKSEIFFASFTLGILSRIAQTSEDFCFSTHLYMYTSIRKCARESLKLILEFSKLKYVRCVVMVHKDDRPKFLHPDVEIFEYYTKHNFRADSRTDSPDFFSAHLLHVNTNSKRQSTALGIFMSYLFVDIISK